jgi:hypothetical protein
MAVTTYNEQSFFELTGVERNTFSFIRLFNILLDEDRETKFMNIFRSYIANEDIFSDIALFETYQVSNGEYWDNVSYNLYETPYLWWVIALLNNTVNPFEELEDGDILNVLRDEYVYTLTSDLEKIAED